MGASLSKVGWAGTSDTPHLESRAPAFQHEPADVWYYRYIGTDTGPGLVVLYILARQYVQKSYVVGGMKEA